MRGTWLQENARQEDIMERERRTQALVKAEIGTQRRASAVSWGIAKSKAAQNASASRMAQLQADFQAVQAATGKLRLALRESVFSLLPLLGAFEYLLTFRRRLAGWWCLILGGTQQGTTTGIDQP